MLSNTFRNLVINRSSLFYSCTKAMIPGILCALFLSCGPTESRKSTGPADDTLNDQLPSVLFVTSGLEEGRTRLPLGITLAIQTFNKMGAQVRLETRDILYRLDSIRRYNMLILSTAPGYYDADRPYSLTFMSDAELENIRDFVRRGGVVIAGDNVGRNYPDGTDRIGIFQALRPGNFALSKVFGMEWVERNMKGYPIEGTWVEPFRSRLRDASGRNVWTLVTDSILSEQLEILARWEGPSDTFPAITRNRFGKGTGYFLASSGFLHPANAGGEWSADRIMRFYELVLDDFHTENELPLRLNPWPGGHESAFCLSLNTEGKPDQYQRLQNMLNDRGIRPTYFVRGRVDQEVKRWLKEADVSLSSSGFSFDNYREMTYGVAIQDILQNEAIWDRSFSGFRFPYTMTAFWGLLALDEQGYSYESSISANNMEFFHGSVFPHNLVISNDQFSHTTELIEIAPTYHDDFHFLQAMTTEQLSPRGEQKKVRLYEDYLLNYWERAVKPYRGLMVYMGHPAYVGHSDTTMRPLESLIEKVQEDNAWLTDMEQVVAYRKDLHQFRFEVSVRQGRSIIRVHGPKAAGIEDLSVRTTLDITGGDVQEGEIEITGRDSISMVRFDAFDGQEVILEH